MDRTEERIEQLLIIATKMQSEMMDMKTDIYQIKSTMATKEYVDERIATSENNITEKTKEYVDSVAENLKEYVDGVAENLKEYTDKRVNKLTLDIVNEYRMILDVIENSENRKVDTLKNKIQKGAKEFEKAVS